MTAELYNTDPARNDKPPPNGAPQGGLPLKRVSATFRVLMAGVADCWAAIQALKGMANQDPAAVAITGGTISGVTIATDVVVSATAADTNKAFGHTVQQIYDLMYPVGEGRVFFNAAAPPIWPNVIASWQLVTAGRYLRTSDPLDAGSTGGDASVSTGAGGAHDHGGVTGDTTLTYAQLPEVVTDVFPVNGNPFPSFQPKNLDPGGAAGLHVDYSDGGDGSVPTDQGHHHTVVPAADHTHTVQLTPLFVDVALYRRIS